MHFVSLNRIFLKSLVQSPVSQEANIVSFFIVYFRVDPELCCEM